MHIVHTMNNGKEPRRTRNIVWKISTDEKAKTLSRQLYGDSNVSRLCELLVEADMRLIAAAPELLAACEAAMRLMTLDFPLEECKAQIEAAIARAKGQ